MRNYQTKNQEFSEKTRVQIPAIVHLTRLGYQYAGKFTEKDAGTVFDEDTNILTDIFKKQFIKLNPEHVGEEAEILTSIKQELDYDDLGKSFYKRLISVSPTRLIDFDHPENNVYHCTGEFKCKNGQKEFTPDITLFVNGLPLVFVEVKKPYNIGGMVTESKRMDQERLPNRKFRRFINITQLMIFSNNMEYDAEGGITPIQGVFYCTGARENSKFSKFREDNPHGDKIAPYNADYPYETENPDVEKRIFTDFNVQVIHATPEYQTNKDIYSPTNRVLTSMCSPERLLFLLHYGIAYVHIEKEVDGKTEVTDQKHIMRYQQMFAALAVRETIHKGIKSGVIWHTQGSGKTALAYHLNGVLTDYFAKNNKVAKFYFIVDRLDLLEQASDEFKARGLEVKTANTRSELMAQFRTTQSLEGNSGNREITVVNIQRFDEDRTKVDLSGYATNLQRIFIVDEAHRGYNPVGSFLANLFDADKDSIKLAFTGTPLLKKERASWKVFGNYIHTYYYDKSIQDGYTLKIIREDIETAYRDKLSKIYDSIEHLVQKKEVPKAEIVEHDKYVKELLQYIITDFNRFRIIKGDQTLGAMIICETSAQARKMFSYFDEIQSELNKILSYNSSLRAGLILFDSDDKETRKQTVKDFKKNMTVDILIVFNMLLTGFDAPRLKRLYLGRRLKDHNLLQALTRVNRPYKDMRYGYVVDFANIKDNFDATNQAYLHELNRFNNPDETGSIGGKNLIESVIEDPQALLNGVYEARQVLFNFNLNNAEIFSIQISSIDDKNHLIEIRKALQSIREAYNIARTFGDDELKTQMEQLNIEKLPVMLTDVEHAISNINQKEAFSTSDETRHIINEAMLDIEFKFRQKGTPEEMKIATGAEQELKEKWQRTIQAFTTNIDQDDPTYITLREAFMQRFREHGFVIDDLADYDSEAKILDDTYKQLIVLKTKNDALKIKYHDDAKYARVHKRIKERNDKLLDEGKASIVAPYDDKIVYFLTDIKNKIDGKVYNRKDILKNATYFEKTVMSEISASQNRLELEIKPEDRSFIQGLISKEYLSQYNPKYVAV